MRVFDNSVKRKLSDGKKVIGAWCQIASPISAEILAEAGFDVIMIDLEHGPGDILTLVSQIQAMKGNPALPFVRAPWNDFVALKRILDAGVFGVLVPYVNTRAEAEAAVRACKYPPLGIRGIAASPRAAGYGQGSMGYLKRANDEVLVMTAVETPEAVANLDEILQTPGLDGIFIGPMDLSTSMGFFADPSGPEVQAAIATIEAKVFAAGKFLATVAGNWAQAQKLYERGYGLLLVLADGTALAGLAAERVAQFRKEYGEG
jgi:2-dehydro-3-deoxyglucarate aldolase/4-hydroxy-2-oxoheptanedioate aldolase